MTVPLKTVDLGEFQEHCTEYMRTQTPLAIIEHGSTMGYYIPVHQAVSDAALHTLEAATQRLHHLLTAQGVDPEELISDYTRLRATRRQSSGKTSHP
jgi:hypothetical protein